MNEADAARVNGNELQDRKWKEYADSDQLVYAIKEFRSLTGAGLKESKDVVEAYRALPKGRNVSVVKIPGGTITITDNGVVATIVYQSIIATSIPVREVHQVIADNALAFGKWQPLAD